MDDNQNLQSNNIQKPKNVFANKNYVLLFLGTLVTNVGAMLYSFAISFYILELTKNDALIQGVYLAFCGIVYILLSPLGGVLADRWKKARIIYMCDYIRGIVIGASAIAIYFIIKAENTTLQIILLFGIGFVSNAISAIFGPASAALLPLLVEQEQLQQANSYFQIMRSLQSIIGIVLAGILYSILPPYTLFAIIAVCYIVSAISEMFITHEHKPSENKMTVKGMLLDFVDGFKYLKGQKALASLVIIMLFINFFISPIFSNGSPYFIKEYVANGDYMFKDVLAPEMWESVFGVASSIGTIVVSFFLSRRALADKSGRSIKRNIAYMSVSIAIIAIGFGVFVLGMNNLNLFLITITLSMLASGACASAVNIPIISVLQKNTEPQYASKVFSLVNIGSEGLIPLATFIGGLLIKYFGLLSLFIFCAVGFIIVTIVLAKNKAVEEL